MAPRALRSAQLDVLKRAIARRYEELLQDTREDVERAREETFGALAGPVTDQGDRAAAEPHTTIRAGRADAARTSCGSPTFEEIGRVCARLPAS
ncbi:MAG TPA: hypothetical protein VFX67_00120, partial [Burkholderiales bacterium]|nr:hypothetical protein [Burkholderiales bacterium]